MHPSYGEYSPEQVQELAAAPAWQRDVVAARIRKDNTWKRRRERILNGFAIAKAAASGELSIRKNEAREVVSRAFKFDEVGE